MSRDKIRHLDEARSTLVEQLRSRWLELGVNRVLIIEDAFGRFTLAVWGEHPNNMALKSILEAIAPFGTDSWFKAPPEADAFDPMELGTSWDEAVSIDGNGGWDDRIRLVVRHRMLPAWQRAAKKPILRELGAPDCPVVAFYSFKGGMGRSTALALFALDRARRDEHVVILDLDIDAPGLGTMLPTDAEPPYGVVDYLLETPVLGKRPDDLRDYYYSPDLPGIGSTGSVKVFSAGRLDEHYLGKMARLDFELGDAGTGLRHPLDELILHVYEELHPDWILVDSRTGFSETAGMLLSGLCDYHVLFGVQADQSWQGLRYAIRKLGVERIHRNLAQAEFMFVQAMVPEDRDTRRSAMDAFAGTAKDLCEDEYYLSLGGPRDDDFWYLDDSGGDDSPDSPVSLSYRAAFSQTVDTGSLLDALESSSEIQTYCAALSRRISLLVPGRKP